MAEQPHSTKQTGAQVLAEIDSTVINVIGGRVFYNHPSLGKCVALVTGVTGKRNAQGQLTNNLTVFRNDNSGVEQIEAALSSDRAVGTFALANPGDLTDDPHTAKPPTEPAVEQPVEEPAPNTNTQATEPVAAETKQQRRERLGRGGR